MPPLLYEKKGPIAYITFNRPEARNPLDPETIVRLAAAWTDFAEDPDLRVAIVTGAGDVSFSAGADLMRLIPLVTRARQPEDEWDRQVVGDPAMIQRALLRQYPLYKPIVAAVNGYCIAGGMELLQAMDIRVASERATFALQEPRWGLFPAGASTIRLPRQVPFCRAMEILLTGNAVSAEEAYRMGLVNVVVPPERVMPVAEEYARAIAANGPLAVRRIKEAVLRMMGLPPEEAFAIEGKLAAEVFSSEDAKEGPRAFKEKRPPQFQGR
jgi:enoyl-CoA hydratase